MNKDVLAIINCGALKQNFSCPAQEMYTGTMFKVVSNYVKTNYTYWCILSAKYGCLLPQDIISPYNVFIKELTDDEKSKLFQKASQRIMEEFSFVKEYHLYVSDEYSSIEGYLSGGKIVFPLKGLSYGQKLHYLNTGNRVMLDTDDLVDAIVAQCSSGVGYAKKELIQFFKNVEPNYSSTYMARTLDCSTVNGGGSGLKKRNVFIIGADGKYYLNDGAVRRKKLF